MDGPDYEVRPLSMGPLQLEPVPGAELQWWFVQGQLAGPTQRFRIMVAVFLTEQDGERGAVLLTHALDEVTGEVHVQSRATPSTLGLEERFARDVVRSRFVGWQSLLRPLARWRHRRDMRFLVEDHPEFQVDARGPRFATGPFAASWAGMLMGHDPRRRELRLSLPLSPGKTLDALIALPDFAMDSHRGEIAPGAPDAYRYQCAPRLELGGRVGAEPVSGTIWLDRQWGTFDHWLVEPAREGKALLGWDWFALTLGPDWQILLNRHHLRPDGDTRGAYAILFEKGQPMVLPAGFSATPIRDWESRVSGARYPVEWDVTIPDLGATLRLQPLSEEQEIPLPGGLTIWEGAGQFEGLLGGAQVSGEARIELVGYAAVLSVRDRIRQRRVTGR